MNPNDAEVQKIAEALRQVFGEGQERQRFIDITRIPLICQSIIQIADDMRDMKQTLEEKFVTKDQFWPIQTLVYGLTSILLTGIVVALLAMVFR